MAEGSLASTAEVVLLDLDGTVYAGGRPVPGAAPAVAACRAAGVDVRFVTNNASLPPGDVAEHLGRVGVPADPAEVRTSSQAGARLVVDACGEGVRVLAVGGPGVAEALRAVGCVPVTSADDDPVAVLQGFGPEVGWAQLTEVAYAVRAGAVWVATNTDATLPRERGPAIGNGSLVAAVRNATGAVPRVAGKPEAPLLQAAADGRLALVVGDRLDTDVAGGRAARMPTLWVSTGVDVVRTVVAAPPEHRPHHLGADLGALLEPAAVVARREDGSWSCGDARARSEGGTLVVDPGGSPIDLLRVVCAASWALADAGTPADVPAEVLARLAPLDAR